ncbi:hypothetical protein SIAM614_10473 [Stappia aggregata IAM 12614]|uniref:Uncharacterized protein n=1 Tax=Roseibium aggregatum (strain ATCC 25650 / DSM 13394 / JCM 20685 / NBRC 16684 / NCIMB 2208 / IAM 12614 / B1) TaxID=384765 RepID=A0NMF2_ROSAI|nr:hypothetical protein SIAM614_10473 [Stappia aggregata IAM 12614] [Roseibium aggregatum IAM 12614]
MGHDHVKTAIDTIGHMKVRVKDWLPCLSHDFTIDLVLGIAGPTAEQAKQHGVSF